MKHSRSISGSRSSSEDESSDEASKDESESGSGSGSGSGSESESGSSSGPGSGDGSNSDSEGDSSSGRGSGGGSSGSSSGEDDAIGSDSEEDSGGSEEEEEEEEEERDTEEKRLARKREDFEKMKEISAHMDNIVQRLSAFFPRDDKESDKGTNESPDPPAVPELPVLPLPQPDKAVDRSVPARIMMMDRAVSARQLTTDRAVSVASGRHFDDDLSASTVSNNRHEAPQNTERRRTPGDGLGVASRTQSATDADWTRRDTTGPEWRVGTRDHHQPDEPRAAQGRRESWQGNERNANSSADTGFGPKTEQGGGRRKSRVSLGSPAAEAGVESSHERLLWDDLRESLAGAALGERVPARSTWSRGVAVEKTKATRDREQRRRRLIDEAIAVLLEGSSSSGSSSDDDRLEDGA